MVGTEASAVVKGRVKVTWANDLSVVVLVAAFGDVSLSLEVLDNDRVARANLEAIGLDTLAKEQLDSLLLANLDGRVHGEALAVPKVVQVALADPLFGPLCVEQVLSVQLNALVMLHVGLQLLVAHHSVTEETELLPGLLLFVVHQLIDEVVLDCLVNFFSFPSSFVLQKFVGRGDVLVMNSLKVVRVFDDVVVMILPLVVSVIMMIWLLIVMGVVVIVGFFMGFRMTVIGKTLMVRRLHLLHELCVLEEVVDRCVRPCQNLSIGQVTLQGFDIVSVATVVLGHVLLKCSSIVL